MKNMLINGSINLIKSNCPDYDDIKLAEIKYGLEGIYLTVTKLIVIFLLAICLNLIKEVLIFLILYNIIRATSFGLHATKSWICLVSSTIIFIGMPILAMYLSIPVLLKCGIGAIVIIEIYKNAPADTHKRPIVNMKRRLIYKTLSVMIAIAFVFASIVIQDTFWSNALLLALVVQCFMISPYIYKFFNLPYDNYKKYKPSSQS